MSATDQFLSNSSISSKTLPATPMLVKPLHPPNPRSRSVRSTTPAASSVFQKLSRCGTNGPNSPNPRAYNPGRLFSSSWSLDCATPRTEGPSEPARPKHTHRSIYPYLVVFRFPPINRFRSSLSLRRLWDDICTPPFASLYTLMLNYRLTFWTNSNTHTHPPTHCMYQLSNHARLR